MKLPTPTGYQDMHLDRDRAGNWYLYMGADYVAFTRTEWAEFTNTIRDATVAFPPSPDTPSRHEVTERRKTCGCTHRIRPTAATWCYVCELPIKQTGDEDATGKDFHPKP